MEYKTSLSKEELLQSLEEIQSLSAATLKTLINDTLHAKINTPFTIILIVISMLYPIFTTAFDIWYYIFLWSATTLLIFIRVNLFMSILGSSTQFATYKILENAINNDLETIRKDEYDNITGKNNTKKDVDGIQEVGFRADDTKDDISATS